MDRNPDAPRGVAFRFEPDATGTTRIMAWLDSCRVPLLTRAWDRINWDGEHDIDAMLSSVKNAVETWSRSSTTTSAIAACGAFVVVPRAGRLAATR